MRQSDFITECIRNISGKWERIVFRSLRFLGTVYIPLLFIEQFNYIINAIEKFSLEKNFVFIDIVIHSHIFTFSVMFDTDWWIVYDLS